MPELVSSGGPLFMEMGARDECAFVVGGWDGWCIGSVTCGYGCCGTGDCSSAISPPFGILFFCAPDVHHTAWLGGGKYLMAIIPRPTPFSFVLCSR